MEDTQDGSTSDLEQELEVVSLVYGDSHTFERDKRHNIILHFAVAGDTDKLPLRPDYLMARRDGELAVLTLRLPAKRWREKMKLIKIRSQFHLHMNSLQAQIGRILSAPVTDLCGILADLESCIRDSAWRLRELELLAAPTEILALEQEHDELSSEESEDKPHVPCVLGRRFCYSHHIRSPVKKRCIVEWARESGLHGCSKVGYPGYIIVEGPLNLVDEYVKELSRLHWAKFVARCAEKVDVNCNRDDHDKGECQALKKMMQLPCPFQELNPPLTDKMGEICNNAGLGDFFRNGLRLG
eukprot:Blabericola_migrator_1__7999@NODE_40_length_17295_cov_124_751393_g36_i0_p6_GENE_NODE_40_length_17295_cov_124_751393_g36_i0NODE_40_length_17295_cov_124_751393_g36_i0_p6_ORF_typecomplete_len298_score31_98DUF1115/PF06544_12/2_1e17_NODE_40_length_17295_cov_124_751393_g36_i01387414767